MYKKIIRISLIIAGAIILISQLVMIINKILNHTFNKITIISFIFLIISYYILIIGIYWKNIFKKLTRTAIFFSALLLTIGIGLQVININTNNITNSLQPSIDYIAASLITNTHIPHDHINENITFIIGTPTYQTLSNNNLTEPEAKAFLKQLGIQGDTTTAKKIITATSTYIQKVYPTYSNTYLPVTLIKQYFQNSVSPEIIKILPINQNSKIKIMYYKNYTELTLNLENPTPQEINKIWHYTGLCTNISTTTKINYFYLTINKIIGQYPPNLLQKIKIPLYEIKKKIPASIRELSCVDLFNPNPAVRVESIKQLRALCTTNLTTTNTGKEICHYVKLTDYNTLMQNLTNGTRFTELKTIDSTKKFIKEKTDYYVPLYIISFLIFLISLSLFYLHHKTTNTPNEISDYLLEISRDYIINLIPTALLIYAFIYLLTKNTSEIITRLAPQLKNNINMVINTPLFKITIQILKETTYIIAAIGTIFIIIYITTFIYKKIKKNNYY